LQELTPAQWILASAALAVPTVIVLNNMAAAVAIAAPEILLVIVIGILLKWFIDEKAYLSQTIARSSMSKETGDGRALLLHLPFEQWRAS